MALILTYEPIGMLLLALIYLLVLRGNEHVLVALDTQLESLFFELFYFLNETLVLNLQLLEVDFMVTFTEVFLFFDHSL